MWFQLFILLSLLCGIVGQKAAHGPIDREKSQDITKTNCENELSPALQKRWGMQLHEVNEEKKEEKV